VSDPRQPRRRLGVLDYLGWQLSLTDDGGEHRTVERTAIWLGRTRKGDLREALRIPRQLFAPSWKILAIYVILAGIATVLVKRMTIGAGWSSVQEFLVLYPAIFLPPALLFAFIAARFRRRSSQYIHLMKARALCPACIHSLEGMQTDSERMVTCPECGARWRFGDAPQ